MGTTRLRVAAISALLGATLAHDTATAGEEQDELRSRTAATAESTAPQGADLSGDHSAQGLVRSGDTWLTHSEAMKAKGLVMRQGAWILREEAEILDLPAKQRELRREGQAKVRKLLDMYAKGGERARKFARASLDTVEPEQKLEPMAFALRSRSAAVRVLAAQELGKLANRRALRPLIHRSIHDPSEQVRHAAIDAAKAVGDANLIAPLVGALDSEDAEVRMNATRALARVGDPRGVRYLVYRFEARGGDAGRAYVMNANQLTFIQDFDVEVASTAFIADPIVGVIQEGVALDVQVVATQQTSHFVEREVVHGALQHLTGATDVENEDGAWAAWFREHGDELSASRD